MSHTHSSLDTAVGFGVYVEHLVEHGSSEEKEILSVPPHVHLGGGAYNIARTLSVLGMTPTVYGVCGNMHGPTRAALDALVSESEIPVTLLPVRERTASSYYVMDTARQSVLGVGDPGGNILITDEAQKTILESSATIRILAEINSESLALAQVFFSVSGGVKVLIPSLELMKSSDGRAFIDGVDILSLNEIEAEEYSQKTINAHTVETFPQPIVFLTRGGESAYLKLEGAVYEALPPHCEGVVYPNGAGDSATAALVYALYTADMKPQEALEYALSIGTKVCQTHKPYLESYAWKIHS